MLRGVVLPLKQWNNIDTDFLIPLNNLISTIDE